MPIPVRFSSVGPSEDPRYDHVALPKRALIAFTSAHAPLYEDNKETGMFVAEALHPYNVFTAEGFDVDFVSETGTYGPDWLSQQDEWLKGEDKAAWEGKTGDFRKKLDGMAKAGDVDPDKYGIFFASAGHASLIDYPTARQLQRLASKVYSDGGIVSAVCHGGAIFPGVVNPVTNHSIVVGKRITGFTTKGEEEQGVLQTIRRWDRMTVEEAAAKAGGEYVGPPGPWDSFTRTDGRVVTGANLASARDTAVAAVKAFDELENNRDEKTGSER
ncbi:plasma membrane heat shock protein [Exophiala xenobiotica]|uniref:D-lactate dehydratase n=1 Tax=Lithohypha guttulata TaxID=1690604 RepID=A0ABR0K5N4_9EURO|nr:plasma membrane heat shock protein [Lithohypha guttulata]KAK5314955.1 plasma membrane heat shock protein [Exophiala xenobiotica]